MIARAVQILDVRWFDLIDNQTLKFRALLFGREPRQLRVRFPARYETVAEYYAALKSMRSDR